MIEDYQVEVTCYILPMTFGNAIFGMDWIHEHEVAIDFAIRSIRFSNKIIYEPTVSFQRRRTDTNSHGLELIFEEQELESPLGGLVKIIQNNSSGDREDSFINAITSGDSPNENFSDKENYKSEIDKTFETRVNELIDDIDTLTKEEKESLKTVVLTNHKAFSNQPGCTNVHEHKIELNDHKPFTGNSYPIPHKRRVAVGNAIDSMLDLGIIERSNSPYLNPITVVPKSDKTVRICLDARRLNKRSKADNERPKPIDELIQKYDGVKYITSTDFVDGYWQVPLEENSRQYTAFLHDSTLYQFRRVPFGLKTAGSGIIRAVSLAFGNEFNDFTTIYVDDVLITSKTFSEHLVHLDLVFKRIIANGFTLKLSKTLFCRQEVPFLGYILSTNGLRINPEKIASIQQFPTPRNSKQLRQFLGLCNYYRRFISRYANFMDSFRELLSTKNKWRWKKYHDTAFHALKESFIHTVVLGHYIPNQPFYVQTDASDCGISAILYQFDEDQNQRIISLVSRCLGPAEKNYTVTELELLAVIYAVAKFRTHLWGTQFNIITDHKALSFLMQSKFNNSRITRWILFLQEYDFTITHCKGRDNFVADLFSRNPLNSDSELQLEDRKKNLIYIAAFEIQMDKEFAQNLKEIERLQKLDTRLSKIIENFEDPDYSHPQYMILGGILFQNSRDNPAWRVCIPKSIIKKSREIHTRVHGTCGNKEMHTYDKQFLH